MIGPLSTDLYLPTFINLAADLDVVAAQVQLTVTGFLIGLACGPLLVGPLSDRYGRRRILLIALAVFVATGLLMVLSSQIWVLIALRVVQGVAAAAGTVLSRAVVSDLAPPEKAVRAMSIIVFAVGLGAFSAAPIGAAVGGAWGWRGALLTLAAIGALMLTLAALFLPESLPPEDRHGKRSGSGSLVALGRAVRTPQVMTFAFTLGATYAAMMSWISASPFVATQVLGLTTDTFALSFAAASVAMLASSSLNAWIGIRVGAKRMLIAGQTLALSAAVLMLISISASALTQHSFFGLGFMLIFGFGLTMANTTALALAAAGHVRGSASALLSTTQYTCGALAVPFIGILGPGSALPMAVTILVAASIAVSMTAITLGRIRHSS